MNKVCKEYISDAKKFFPIMGKDERNYLRGVSGKIEECCAENNITSKHELFKQYGQPYEIANDYYETFDTEEIIKKIRISKYKKILVSIIVAVILVVASIRIVDFIQRRNIFSNEEIVDSFVIDNNANLDEYDNEHDIDKSDNFIDDEEIIEEEIIE